MRVLVTGAAGFVGTAVLQRLHGSVTVRAADVVTPAGPADELCVGDLGDWSVVRRAVAGVDAVIHLATGGVRPGTTPPMAIADSVGATVGLFEAIRGAPAPVGRVVLVSSGAVVTGYPRGVRIAATTPVRFRGLYPLTKHLQEEVARHYAEELGVVVPTLRPWVVVDAETRRLRDGTFADASGDPFAHNGPWGWIDRGDLADACHLALGAPLTGAPVIPLMANPLGRALIDAGPADALGWRPRHRFTDDLPPGTPIPEPPATTETAR